MAVLTSLSCTFLGAHQLLEGKESLLFFFLNWTHHYSQFKVHCHHWLFLYLFKWGNKYLWNHHPWHKTSIADPNLILPARSSAVASPSSHASSTAFSCYSESCIGHFFAFLLLVVLSHFKVCSGIVLLFSLLLVVLGFWKRMSVLFMFWDLLLPPWSQTAKMQPLFRTQREVIYCAYRWLSHCLAAPSFIVCTWVTAVPCYYQWCCSEHFCTCLLVNVGKGFFGYMSKRDLLDHGAWTFTQQGNSNYFKVAEPTYTPTNDAFRAASNLHLIFLTLGIV